MSVKKKESLLRKYLLENKVPNSATTAYLAMFDHLGENAPNIAKEMINELRSQRSHLKLIASENYTSLSVQLSMGNWLTDKYAEGIPNKRFYAGCESIDVIEHEGVELLKDLFSCEHAYIQPHSGADANLVAFWTILIHKIQNPEIERLGKKSIDSLTSEEYEAIRQLLVNQKLMGMALSSGGHLTHGYRHNISSKMMQSVSYECDPETGLLNYDLLARQVKQEKPTILLAGYSAYPRCLDFARLREIADSVGATLMTDMAHFAGLVAGKALTNEANPIPYSDIVTSTTHKTLRGPRGGIVLCKKEYKETVDKGCPMILGGPLPHVLAAKAIAFKEASTTAFETYAHQVIRNSKALGELLMKKGISLVTGGTDNHLLVLDVRNFKITGRQAEGALKEAGITVNRNTVPLDPNGPWYTSGVRLGTAALTTLGMKEDHMEEVASIIYEVLSNSSPSGVDKAGKTSKAKYSLDKKIVDSSRSRVFNLLSEHKLYPELDPLLEESS
jgi:glycine hydroxymethyltransferase